MGADGHCDLELNLSISSPSGTLKGNDNIRSMQLHEATYELANSGKRSKVCRDSTSPFIFDNLGYFDIFINLVGLTRIF